MKTYDQLRENVRIPGNKESVMIRISANWDAFEDGKASKNDRIFIQIEKDGHSAFSIEDARKIALTLIDHIEFWEAHDGH